MKKLNNRQYGVTFIGVVFILGIIAFFALFALRLFPLYNEKFTVLSSMETVANRPDAVNLSIRDVRKYFLINVQLGNLPRFDDNTVKELVNVQKDKKTNKKYLHVAYQAQNVFFKEIKLALDFDHKIQLGGGGVEE